MRQPSTPPPYADELTTVVRVVCVLLLAAVIGYLFVVFCNWWRRHSGDDRLDWDWRGPDDLTSDEVSDLARYNTDRARGVVFDAATVDRMTGLQRRYDTARAVDQVRTGRWS